MCTLSQKNAVNDYFVHTEKKSSWNLSEFWSGKAHNGNAATVDNSTPMPHDANSAKTDSGNLTPTVDNGNLTQELAEAKEEMNRLLFLTETYSAKMLAHETQIKRLKEQREAEKEEIHKLKVDRQSLLVNMLYFENHLNRQQKLEIDEEKNKMLNILKMFCDWGESGETFRDAHRMEARQFHWQLQKYLETTPHFHGTTEEQIARYSGFIKYKHILDEDTKEQERGTAGFVGNLWL
jgi:hypothetical protein